MDLPSPSPRGVLQVQPVPAPTQRATLVTSPSATSTETSGSRGLLPALEQLQRISQGGHQRNASSGSGNILPPLSSRGAFPVDEAGVAPGPSAPPHHHLYHRLTGLPQPATALTSRPPVHPSATVSTSVSSISQPHQQAPSLPTYRQANSLPGDRGDGRPPSSPSGILPGSPSMDPSLPDLLHSHMVPPQVPPARPNQHRHQRRSVGGRGPSGDGGNGARRHQRRSQQQQVPAGSRQRRRSRTTSGGSTTTATAGDSGMCKEPCVRCVATITSFRWVLVMLSVLGVFCVIAGVVLAALRAAGNSFLFLAIMFIGLGILLVIVVVVGWKCTPRGHEPLHALFGIGNFRHGRSGQPRERRRRRHRNRDGNWYGGVLYPEFQYRRPPPSYAASMQDYQNQQLQHGGGDADTRSGQSASIFPYGGAENSSLPNSPPPSYRSRASTAHSGIHIAFPAASSSGNAGGGDNQGRDLPASRPPTYRSRAPSRRPSLPMNETSGDFADGDVDFGGEASAVGPASSNLPERTDTSLQNRQVGDAATVASSQTTVSATSPTSQSATASPSSSSSPHSVGSVTLQVYTLPTVRADNQNPSLSSTQFQGPSSNTVPNSGARTFSTTPGNTMTALSSTSATAAASSLPSSSVHSSAGIAHMPSMPPARLPSLHQRMESGDRRMLEDALQSLEEHFDNDEVADRQDGIVNPAASFDPEEPSEHFSTHL